MLLATSTRRPSRSHVPVAPPGSSPLDPAGADQSATPAPDEDPGTARMGPSRGAS